MELTLPHSVELHVSVWLKGTTQAFVHTQQALCEMKQKPLLVAYEKAIKDQGDFPPKMTTANEAMTNYTGEDAHPPKAKAGQKASEVSKHASDAEMPIIIQVLQLYPNLISEEAWKPWNKVLWEQINRKP